jgi:thioredoxin-like negative regulator of GroEL
MVCAKLKPAVSGLEKEYEGKVKAANVDASTPEAKKAVQELGFKSHGLVIRDAQGKAVFKQPDHTVNLDEARKALADLLKN